MGTEAYATFRWRHRIGHVGRWQRGLSLALTPGLPAPGLIKFAGWLLLLIPLAYLIATKVRRTPLNIWRFDVPLPWLRLAGYQYVPSGR